MDEVEDSLGAEDPTVEIARLLRPVEARTNTRPAGQTTRPAAETAATPADSWTPATPPARRPAESEPLLLGTSETPKIDARAASPSGPAADAGGLADRRTGLARRASDVTASDRRGAGAPDRQDGTATPASEEPGKSPQPPAASRAAGLATEPLGETLPRCLTEPWEDPDPDWLQVGQDKGARRWPFRRGRAGRQDEDGPDDGTEGPK